METEICFVSVMKIENAMILLYERPAVRHVGISKTNISLV